MSFNLFPQYDYCFPQELVANKPAEPRDSARLMVVDTKKKKITFSVFSEVHTFLDENDLLVFNDTKVVPARLTLVRDKDEIEALFLMNEYEQGSRIVPVIVNKHLNMGDRLVAGGVEFVVDSQNENVFFLKFKVTPEALFGLLQEKGTTPIPKYIQDVKLSEDELREKYQTVFAKNAASAAAPTASLHFTEDVFRSLEKKRVDRTFVTLHVGLGTFMPVTPENIETSTLHSEPIHIPTESTERIAEQKEKGKSVVAVGTTAVRTLESSAQQILQNSGDDIEKSTNLFIQPPYDFDIVDKLITNFHVPQSSLMCLVDAFLQYKNAPWSIVEIYEKAIEEKMRLFSFGDAMLIL